MDKNIFEVGQVLSFESYYKVHLPSPVIGWQKDEFVLTKALYIGGQPAKLQADDTVRIRFLKDGTAYGFESKIITVQFYPFPLMFVKYPTDVEHLKIRISTRYKVNIISKLLLASGEVVADDASLIDISEGGCGLKVPVQEGRTLSPETDYEIAFKIMDREVRMGCGVRKFDQRGKYAVIMGMEFTKIAPKDKETLAFFIDFLSQNAML
ncbi:MAG TPA: flagellar brake protein [Nitrospirota bacterium]|nr:flagellar brake protein [Nitrospirota bacterium]